MVVGETMRFPSQVRILGETKRFLNMMLSLRLILEDCMVPTMVGELLIGRIRGSLCLYYPWRECKVIYISYLHAGDCEVPTRERSVIGDC